jgi:hypothetical protein
MGCLLPANLLQTTRFRLSYVWSTLGIIRIVASKAAGSSLADDAPADSIGVNHDLTTTKPVQHNWTPETTRQRLSAVGAILADI